MVEVSSRRSPRWGDAGELKLMRVDRERRRRQIAPAVAGIWAAKGARGCTFRAVAAELGVSPTVLTDAFGTSAAMLEYTLVSLLDAWEKAGKELLNRNLEPSAMLRELLYHQCPLDDEGLMDARIWLDAMAALERPAWSSAAFVRYDAWLSGAVAVLLKQCNVAPQFTDVLLTAVFGLNAAAVQSPEAWPPSRVRATLDEALDGVIGRQR